MKTKLMLFEGIPGSGKSTFAHKSALVLNKMNVANTLYREGCLHPANLDGYVAVPIEKLDELINKFPKFETKIKNHLIKIDDYILVQRQKDYRVESAIFNYLQQYEICGKGNDFELFKKLNLFRWLKFSDTQNKKEETAIFECAFIQDQITELILFFEKSTSDILEYFKKLEETILKLNPFLFYFQQKDAGETIRRITEQRVNEPDGRPWGERVAELVSESSYGKTHNLTGYNGMVEFFKRRKEMDLLVVDSLKLRHIIIDNDNYDWKAMQIRVFEILKNLADE